MSFHTINMDPRVNAGASLWQPPVKAVAVAAGYSHTLVVTENGRVFAAGSNERSQCTVPAGLDDVVVVGAGVYHSLAVRSDGTVVAWGQVDGGALEVPPGLDGVVAVDAGIAHSVALRQDGALVVWGSLFDRSNQPPEDLEAVRQVVCGGWATFVLTDSGKVLGWGHNAEFGTVSMPRLPEGKTFVQLAVRQGIHSKPVAVDAGGAVFASEGYGAMPETGMVLPPVAHLTAGEMHSVALLKDGAVVGWGDSPVRHTVPDGLIGVAQVAAGGDHTVALRSDGSVVVWGKNGYGQLERPAGWGGEFVGWQGAGYTLPSLVSSAGPDPYAGQYGIRTDSTTGVTDPFPPAPSASPVEEPTRGSEPSKEPAPSVKILGAEEPDPGWGFGAVLILLAVVAAVSLLCYVLAGE